MRRLYTILPRLVRNCLEFFRDCWSTNMDYLDVPGVDPWWEGQEMGESREPLSSEELAIYVLLSRKFARSNEPMEVKAERYTSCLREMEQDVSAQGQIILHNIRIVGGDD